MIGLPVLAPSSGIHRDRKYDGQTYYLGGQVVESWDPYSALAPRKTQLYSELPCVPVAT